MLQIKCPSCGELQELSKMCHNCGASIPSSLYEKTKRADEAYHDLPEILIQLKSYDGIEAFELEKAESLYEEGKEMIKILTEYQSVNQPDFNILNTKITALYSKIQDVKRKEEQRKQDEINEAKENKKRQARQELNRIKSKRLVFSLIYYGFFILVVFGVFMLKHYSSEESLNTWLVGGLGLVGLIIGVAIGGVVGAIIGLIVGGLSGALIKLLLTTMLGNVIFVFLLFILFFFLHGKIVNDKFYISEKLQKRVNGEDS